MKLEDVKVGAQVVRTHRGGLTSHGPHMGERGVILEDDSGFPYVEWEQTGKWVSLIQLMELDDSE